MNLCVVSGKIINELDFKFVYDANKESLGKTHISIVKVMLELENGQAVELHAYNEMADFFLRKWLTNYVNNGMIIEVYEYTKKWH